MCIAEESASELGLDTINLVGRTSRGGVSWHFAYAQSILPWEYTAKS
jgi:hypothetical protein